MSARSGPGGPRGARPLDDAPSRSAFLPDLRALAGFRGLVAPLLLPALLPVAVAYVAADLRGTSARAIAVATDAIARAPHSAPSGGAVGWRAMGSATGALLGRIWPGAVGPSALIVAVAGLLIAASLLVIARDVARLRVATEFKRRLRTALLGAMARGDDDTLRARGTGALVDVFRSDVDAVASVAVMNSVGVVESVVQLAVYGVLLARTLPPGEGWRLFLAFLALLAAGQLASIALTERRERQLIGLGYQHQQRALTRTTRFFEVLRELMFLGGAEAVGEALVEDWADVDRRSRATLVWTRLGTTPAEIVQQLAVPIVLLVAVRWGSGDVGAVLGAVVLFAQLGAPLSTVLAFRRVLAQCAPSLRTVRAALDTPAPGEPPADVASLLARDVPPRVTLRGVRVRVDGMDVDRLADVDLEIPAGAFVAVVGRTGSGKTTLARLIAGELRPVEGRLLFDGCDATRWPAAWRRQLVAFAPSPPHFLLESLRANILAGRDVSDAELAEALAVSRADDVVAGQPLGLDAPFVSGESFATGEQRRVALARALCSRQRVLILDEPTAQVNPAMLRDIGERLRAWVRRTGRTCLVVTHDEAVAGLADLVVLVADRTVAAAGPPRVLRDDPRYVAVFDAPPVSLAAPER